MTFRHSPVYICDQCGKEQPAGENHEAVEGWLALSQQRIEAPDAWTTPVDLGDFCSLTCLEQFVYERLTGYKADVVKMVGAQQE